MSVRTSPDRVKALFLKSAEMLQRGDAAGAKKGLLKVAKQLPDSAVVWYNLGLSHQFLKENHRAATAYKKAVAIKHDFIDAWVNLGLAHKAMNEPEDAEKAGQAALALDSNHVGALNLLGAVAAEQGRREEAMELLTRALQQQPHDTDVRFNLAALHLEMDDAEQALATAERLFTDYPDEKKFRQLHAQILIGQRKYDEAVSLVLKLQEQYPDDEEVLRIAVNYREVIRDHFGVIESAQKLLDKLPKDASAWNSLGNGYFQLDSIEKAKSCYDKAIDLDADHPEYECNVGLAFSSLGDRDNAELHYRRSIELEPRHAEAYRSLVTMKRFSSMDDIDARTVEKLWNEDNLDDFTRTNLAFALGKIYDDCGLYDAAFDTYKCGNDLKFKESRMKLADYFAHMDRIPRIFDRRPLTVVPEATQPQPIFILGMPRSGTTLVEQIICRHPQVFGCGELPCIERAITRMEKRADPPRVYPDDFWEVTYETFAAEKTEYNSWLRRLHDIHTPYITDKMPFNFVHVWLIKTLFPGAAIVHCQRHPLDIITSNYFQFYGSDVSFVYNLEALASYYVRYHRLMEHWHQLFEEEITRVQYETLVQDSDAETRRLIAAIGLDWDDACLDQKRSDTAVRTASIWQVRQGIYTRSKERWRNYEKQLQEAIAMLMQENILPAD